MSQLKKVFPIIIIMITIVALLGVVKYYTKNVTVTTLDAFELKDMVGETNAVRFDDKPSVLLFFTSWCPYCNQDAPEVVKLHQEFKDKINLYGINVIARDDKEEVEKYITKHNIEYPVLLDEGSELYNKLGAQGFPSMFFVNRDGTVVNEIIGSADPVVIAEQFLSLLN